MNKRTVLLTAVLVLSIVFAVYAQTNLEVRTGGISTTTVTVKKASYQDESFSGKVYNNGTTTGYLTWIGGSDSEQSLINIGETAIASASVPTGNLALYWDTTNLGIVIKYNDATGTVYTTLLPGVDTDSPAGYAVLSGGNAFSGNQTVVSGEVRVATTTDQGAFPLQVVGKSYFSDELSVGSTTDMGAYPLQVAGDAIVKDTVNTQIRVQSASSTGYSQVQFLNDGSSEAYIAQNGSAYATGGGANALEIYNAAAKPIKFYQGSVSPLTMTASGALVLPQIATPPLATGTMFFSSADARLYFSKDGAAWTALDN